MSDPATKPRSSAPTQIHTIAAASGDGWRLVVVSGDGAYFASHSLPSSGQITIGRSKDCDVRIDDASISRTHAMLHLGPNLYIEDTGSANGSFARGTRLAPRDKKEISAGEAVTLGTVTVLVQRRAHTGHSWRLWGHSYFEGRLEDECARADRFDLAFALLHVHFDSSVPAPDMLAAIEAVTDAGDVVGDYGANQYQLLIVEAERQEAEQIARELKEAQEKTRVGIACYPQDGRDPHSLSDRARAGARGEPAGPPDGEPVVTAGDERMVELRQIMRRVAAGSISVLLLGESGVGKEVFARTVHNESPRASKSFVALNCGAFTETLLEAELFGHKRGAFTGAVRDNPGLLEKASGGTVFLDEVGELSLPVQVKLLRVFEERKVRRVGEHEPRSIDVRFVCATNRDLEAEIARGNFREDLYYRINGFSVVIPPLRERVAEIEPLARLFIGKYCQSSKRYPRPDISPEALGLLMSYRWPGNIRELRNAMERAVLLCASESIEPEHLPLDKMRAKSIETPGKATDQTAGASSPRMLTPAQQEDAERIKEALRQCNGNQTRAAELLGIARRTLINRIERYGLPRPRKRS